MPPLGTFTRTRLDFALNTAGWCTATQAAVLAQFGFVSLFNNDNMSRPIAVYGVTSSLNSTAIPPMTIRFIGGSVGAAGTGLRPVVLGGPQPIGQQRAGTDVAQLGTLLTLAQTSNQGSMLFTEQPLVVLPVNFSLIVQANVTNLIMSVAILFAPIRLRRR
jgi:hypothetical protein